MSSSVKINLFKEIDLKDSYFITGFQGFGLVGYLASKHIVRELGFEKIGFIKTKYMPEIVFYGDNDELNYPFELYYQVVGSRKIMVLVNHATPHARDRTVFAENLCRWLKNNNISLAILLGGLDPSLREEGDEKYRWIPIGGYKGWLEAKKLYNKYVVGPLALTMLFADAYKIPGVAVLAYTELYRPDPRASAVAVDVVSRIIGVSIDTRKLLEEADLIEAAEEERRKLMKTFEGEIKPERRGFSMHV